MMNRFFIAFLSADKVLGALGGGLAVASLGFGVYMNVHGPVASFGHSKDFTVFAQLAPREAKDAPVLVAAAVPTPADVLDMTETASIQQPGLAASRKGPSSAAPIIRSVTLQAVSADAATILVDGHAEMVRIGDMVRNAGEVLEITPGARPSVRTSLGIILSSKEP